MPVARGPPGRIGYVRLRALQQLYQTPLTNFVAARRRLAAALRAQGDVEPPLRCDQQYDVGMWCAAASAASSSSAIAASTWCWPSRTLRRPRRPVEPRAPRPRRARTRYLPATSRPSAPRTRAAWRHGDRSQRSAHGARRWRNRAEIRAGQFTPDRYRHYFPRGIAVRSPCQRRATPRRRMRSNGHQRSASITQSGSSVSARLSSARRNSATTASTSTVTFARRHWNRARTLSELRLDEIRPRIWLHLRDHLLGLSLKPKTVKNILGSLRALVHDARERTDFIQGSPFATMKWTRTPPAEPDPFDAAERDRIVEWFRDRKPHYYPFVLTLFRTGMRPSEATALRWARRRCRPWHHRDSAITLPRG